MNAPLFNRLIEYSKNNTTFHMPGHKFGKGFKLEDIDLTKIDVTEAYGLDNLYTADGIILEAEKLLANFYGSKETIFLTNGSTSGILASILATCGPNDKILVSRNCHHSVWSGLILAGCNPIYISPNYNYEHGLMTDIDALGIEKALKDNEDIKAVLIVSPTYEGIVSDIEEIADVVHRYNKVLIIDEAHGAHFSVSDKFPISSVKLGADIVINSTHKTLPTLTQSALLHIATDRISKEKIIAALRMIQTSSPSYVMMGVMDYVRAYIEENRAEIESDYIENLTAFRENLRSNFKNLLLLDSGDINIEKKKYDISKVIIYTKDITGYELEEILINKYNITLEASFKDYIILMTTLADDKEILDTLYNALIEIDNELSKGASINEEKNTVNKILNYAGQSVEKLFLQHINKDNYTQELKNIYDNKIIYTECTPREVYYANQTWIDLNEAEGKVAAENIMLYPPGIPVICLGEKFEKYHIEKIKSLYEKLQGIKFESDNNEYTILVKVKA